MDHFRGGDFGRGDFGRPGDRGEKETMAALLRSIVDLKDAHRVQRVPASAFDPSMFRPAVAPNAPQGGQARAPGF